MGAAMSRSIGALTIDLIAKTFGFEAGMNKAARNAEKNMKAIQASSERAAKIVGAAIGATFSTAVLAIAKLTKDAINNADALRDSSIQLGISTETLSAYGYAATQTGTDIDELSKGLKILAKNAAEALDPKSSQAGLFKALGIDVKDAYGNLKQFDVLLPEVANKFKLLEDGTTKAALAQSLLGKSGVGLTEFLNQGAQGLEDFAEKAKDLGIIVSTQAAAAADEFKDKLGDLQQVMKGLGLSIAEGVLPQLSKSTDEFKQLVNQGDLARNVITLFNSAVSAGVVVLRGYNRAVEEMSISIGFAVQAGKGLLELQHNVATFGAGSGSVIGGLKRVAAGYGEASDASKVLQEQWKKEDDLRRVREQTAGQYTDSNVRRRGGGLSAEELRRNAKDRADAEATAKRLNTFLGGTPSKSKSEKSEAEKLTEAYKRLNASMAEQIALFGETTEAAKLRYDLENGELSKLDQARKDVLISQAEQLDQMRQMKELEDAAADRLKEETQAYEQHNEEVQKFIEDLRVEGELIGLSNKDREIAIAQRYAGVDAMSAEGQEIAGLIEQNMLLAESYDFIKTTQDDLADSFVDFISGAKSAKEAFGDFADSLFKRALQFVTDKAIQSMFDAFNGTGTGNQSSGGGWFQSLLSIFGGARAGGGLVSPNSFVEVNERGIEMASVGGRDFLLAGAKGAMITPAHQVGGGINQTNQFYLAAPTSQRTQEQIAQKTGQTVEDVQRRNK